MASEPASESPHVREDEESRDINPSSENSLETSIPHPPVSAVNILPALPLYHSNNSFQRSFQPTSLLSSAFKDRIAVEAASVSAWSSSSSASASNPSVHDPAMAYPELKPESPADKYRPADYPPSISHFPQNRTCIVLACSFLYLCRVKTSFRMYAMISPEFLDQLGCLQEFIYGESKLFHSSDYLVYDHKVTKGLRQF